MNRLFWPVACASLSFTLAAPVCSTVRGGASTSRPLMKGTRYQTAAQKEKREPTFEETRDFILKYTGKEWEENPGTRHSYALTFTRKRLKYVHRFTSRFVPGFVEKMEVELDDLDPTRVDKGDYAYHYLSLATTDGERKIAVETIPFGSIDDSTVQRAMNRTMYVPGSDKTPPEEQEKMDVRLKKAWAHLIKLAGGKPSKDEPF